MAKKANINDYKDRMSSPIGAVRLDPKTMKPAKSKTAVKKTK